MAWLMYVLRCSDDSLYCGITNDLAVRLKKHNAGKGAKYTRTRLPLEVVAAWTMPDRGAALKAEYRFKQLSRVDKLRRIRGEE